MKNIRLSSSPDLKEPVRRLRISSSQRYSCFTKIQLMKNNILGTRENTSVACGVLGIDGKLPV